MRVFAGTVRVSERLTPSGKQRNHTHGWGEARVFPSITPFALLARRGGDVYPPPSKMEHSALTWCRRLVLEQEDCARVPREHRDVNKVGISSRAP
jgi:hypothetical protein